MSSRGGVSRLAVRGALIVLGAAPAPGILAHAQAAVSVRGVVFDSLHFSRAAGAVIEFADAGNLARGTWQATSDTAGQFVLQVPSGRYLVGVRTSLLDSLDVEAPTRTVVVGERALDLPLELPSLGAIASALCGTQPGDDVNGVLVLRVGDAATDTADVEIEWDALEFADGGAVRAHRTMRARALLGETFRACGPPPGARVGLRARAPGRLPFAMQLRLPSRGVAVQDIELRAAPRGEGVATVPDGRPGPMRTVMVTVTDAEGRPVRGALARGPAGSSGRSDEQGVARVQGVPAGSVDIEVTALGYVPARRIMTPEPPTPDTVTIALARTELTPVRVTANGDGPGDAGLRRRLAFGGTVLTPEDFVRRGARNWTDAARTIAGVRVAVYPARPGSTFQIRRLEMTSSAGKCVPTVWLDGQRTTITDFDWDQFIPLDQVARIEVYGSATVPMEFRAPGSACGAVLIWTGAPRLRPPPAAPSSG